MFVVVKVEKYENAPEVQILLQENAILISFPPGAHCFGRPQGGTTLTDEQQSALQGADVQQNERSRDVFARCLSPCPSTTSYLHILDCTHLTD